MIGTLDPIYIVLAFVLVMIAIMVAFGAVMLLVMATLKAGNSTQHRALLTLEGITHELRDARMLETGRQDYEHRHFNALATLGDGGIERQTSGSLLTIRVISAETIQHQQQQEQEQQQHQQQQPLVHVTAADDDEAAGDNGDDTDPALRAISAHREHA